MSSYRSPHHGSYVQVASRTDPHDIPHTTGSSEYDFAATCLRLYGWPDCDKPHTLLEFPEITHAGGNWYTLHFYVHPQVESLLSNDRNRTLLQLQ